MFEAEAGGVQRRPAQCRIASARSSVDDVSDHRQTSGGQMNSDLMCASGFWSNLELTDPRLSEPPKEAQSKERH